MNTVPAPVIAIHDRVWAAVAHCWEPNSVFGHGVDHATRAYAHGLRLAIAEGANPLPVGASCYLMDAGLDLATGRRNHVARSMALASKICAQISELYTVRDTVIAGVQFHEADDPLPPGQPVEVLAVRDSDTLDRMGLTGVRMTLTYGTWIGRSLCHPSDPLCEHRTPALDHYTMDYVRHLFSLRRALSTETAKVIGDAKLTEQNDYLASFKRLYRSTSGALQYGSAFSLVEEMSETYGER